MLGYEQPIAYSLGGGLKGNEQFPFYEGKWSVAYIWGRTVYKHNNTNF